MAFSHIPSGQIERDKVEAVTDFTFLGSKITVDGDCSCEIKRCLLPGRKAMINLASILKSRYINLLIKAHIVKAMVSPIVMYGPVRAGPRLSTEELIVSDCGAGEDC